MLNKNYGLEQAKKLGYSIERVENDKIEIWFAKRNPKYIETSNDRPNFYVKFLYDKALETNPRLTQEQYIDSVIEKYENNELFLHKVVDKEQTIISSYLVDNITLVLSIRPFELVKQLGISFEEVYNLNYLKIYLPETNETKYFWINDFANNDNRKESITLTCGLDTWLTYYKQVVPNLNGNVKVLRKHWDRYIKRNDQLVGDYSANSPIHNIDSAYASMTTGVIRSLGVDIIQDELESDTTSIVVENNEVAFEFYVWDEYENKKVKIENYTIDCLDNESTPSTLNESFKFSGSGNYLAFSAYNQDGTLSKDVDDKIVSTTYTNLNQKIATNKIIEKTLKFDKYFNYKENWDLNSYKCYGPITIGNSYTKDFKYIYVRKYQAGDIDKSKGDAYGVLMSKKPLDDDVKYNVDIISRISNTHNKRLLNSFVDNPSKVSRAQPPRWKYVVMANNRENMVMPSNAISFNNSVMGIDTINCKFSSDHISLKLYLVDLNTKNDYGDYGTKHLIPTSKVCLILPNKQAFNNKIGLGEFQAYGMLGAHVAEQFLNLSYMYGGMAKPIIGVSFNGNVNSIQYSQEKGDKTCEFLCENTIVENGLSYDNTSDEPLDFPIRDWNETSTLEVNFTNEINLQQYQGIMESLKLQYSPVIYEKDANWLWSREPQLKMGHCIKHFINYLGATKQIFLEYGSLNALYLSQTILPNGCIDKIYYVDNNNDYNYWELANTNGFLTKTYDNSIPWTSDSYSQFIVQNKAQLTNSYFTASSHLDFAKQQAALNMQAAKASMGWGIASGILGMVGGAVNTGFGTSMYNRGINSQLEPYARNWAETQAKDFGLSKYDPFYNEFIQGWIANKDVFRDDVLASQPSLGWSALQAGMGGIQMAKGLSSMGSSAHLGAINLKQTALNNKKMIFDAQQQVHSIEALVQDKFNTPDQLNNGSVECNAIIRYQQELSTLFKQYGVNEKGALFKIDTQAPNLLDLENYSMFLNQNGYISNKMLFNVSFNDLLSRTRFNYIQLGDIQNLFAFIQANQETKNYFMNMFNNGVRLWNIDYENQEMLDYSKENWEISLELGKL